MSSTGRSGSTEPASEAAFNFLLGLSVLSWAVLGLVTAGEEELTTPVRWVISALHLSVAGLLIFRGPAARHGSPAAVAMSLPGLLISGWALSAAPSPSQWPWPAQVLLTAGGLLAIVTFFYLGKSFAILPALRGIVVRGTYRLVRHPAYTGELLMIFGCVLARPVVASVAAFFLAVPLVALRIHAEEALLMTRRQYRSYAGVVRWRLVPGLW